MKVQIVLHDEYFGTVSKCEFDMPDNSGPLEVWRRINDQTPDAHDEPNTACCEGYLEDWDAYGSHHAGMITRAWWGAGAEQLAEEGYKRILDSGAEPT